MDRLHLFPLHFIMFSLLSQGTDMYLELNIMQAFVTVSVFVLEEKDREIGDE